MCMKQKILLLNVIIILLSSCKKDDKPGKTDPDSPASAKLEISYETLNFSAEKDASLVVVKTNESWQANCNADWIELSTYEGDTATGFIVGASANHNFERESEITIATSKESKEISVKQAGVSFIEFNINGTPFRFFPVKADTSFYLDGATYLATRTVFLNSFFISETEITNAQWRAVTGSLPYDGEDNYPDLPVIVNWKDINSHFIPEINELTDYECRLPTENEWEVAARGGLKSKNTNYAGSMYVDEVAWYFQNSEGRKHQVGIKLPNELGLYDMSGNVSEWCGDWYEEWTEENRPPSNSSNPVGPSTGTKKVIRGGDFLADRFEYDRNSCLVYSRNYLPPDISTPDFLYDGYNHYTGFRLVIAKK